MQGTRVDFRLCVIRESAWCAGNPGGLQALWDQGAHPVCREPGWTSGSVGSGSTLSVQGTRVDFRLCVIRESDWCAGNPGGFQALFDQGAHLVCREPRW